MPKHVMMGDALEAAVVRYDLDRQALVDWVWNCGCGFHRKRRYEDLAGWAENAQARTYGGPEDAVKALELLLNTPRPWEDRDAQPPQTMMIQDNPHPREGPVYIAPPAPAPTHGTGPSHPPSRKRSGAGAGEEKGEEDKGEGVGEPAPASTAAKEPRKGPKTDPRPFRKR